MLLLSYIAMGKGYKVKYFYYFVDILSINFGKLAIKLNISTIL